MLKIRIGTQYLALPKDFALGYNLVTNVLQVDERNENSFTLPIRVPMNEQIAHLFGYAYDPQIKFDTSQIYADCAVQLSNNDFWKGAIEIASINDDEVNLIFRFGSGYIPTVNQKTRLRDFFREKTFTITGNTSNYYKIQWPNDGTEHQSYKVVVNGNTYEQLNGEEFDSDYYLEQLALSIDYIHVVSASFDDVTKIMTIQSAFNQPLTVVATYVEAVTSSVINLLVKNRAQFQFGAFEGQGTVYELPPMYLPNLYDGQILNYRGWANTHEIGGFYEIPLDINELELTIVPVIKDKWLLQQVFADFGIELTGDYFTDGETSQRFEFVPRPIDQEVIKSSYDTGLNVTIPVAEYLPDITLSEWLLSLKAEACMSITFDPAERVASFNLIEAILTSTDYEDWTQYLVKIVESRPIRYNGIKLGYELDDNDQELKANAKPLESFSVLPPVADLAALAAVASPQNSDVRFVKSKNAFYKYFVEFQGTTLVTEWRFFAHNLDDLRDAEEERHIRSAYAPLADIDLDFEEKDMRVPTANVVGFLPSLELTDNDFAPRFSIYRGLQKDVQDNDYRMASMGIHKADESAIIGATTDFSPGVSDASLENVRHKAFIGLLKENNQDVMLLDLPLVELHRFDQLKKKRINGVDYVVLSLSGEIRQSGPSTIQALMQRIP